MTRLEAAACATALALTFAPAAYIRLEPQRRTWIEQLVEGSRDRQKAGKARRRARREEHR